MKSKISGWSYLNIPILAPLLLPPCLITSVATSNTRMNEIGPEATPPVDFTISSEGRIPENEKPVPPPLL